MTVMNRLGGFRRVGLVMMSAGLMSFLMCNGGDENFKSFRTSAGPGLQSGVTSILTGDGTNLADGLNTIITSLLDGLFSIVEPDK